MRKSVLTLGIVGMVAGLAALLLDVYLDPPQGETPAHQGAALAQGTAKQPNVQGSIARLPDSAGPRDPRKAERRILASTKGPAESWIFGVCGKVITKDGVAVSGARIVGRAAEMVNETSGCSLSVKTDEHGVFRVGPFLNTMSVLIEVNAKGCYSLSRICEIGSRQTFVLGPSGAIVGHVGAAGSRSVMRGSITATPEYSAPLAYSRGSAYVSADGQYRIDSLRPGFYRVQYKTARRPPAVSRYIRVVAQEETLCDLQLRDGGTIVGTVLDGGSERGLEKVVVYDVLNESNFAETDAAGNFRLPNVLGPSCCIGARKDGFLPSKTTVPVGSTQQATISIRLWSGWALIGKATSESGGSLPVVNVDVRSMKSHLLLRTKAPADSGMFSVEGLPFGENIEVQLRATGYAPLFDTVRLESGGGAKSLRHFRLRTECRVTGAVRRAGVPMKGAFIVVCTRSEISVDGAASEAKRERTIACPPVRADVHGEFRVSGLAKGKSSLVCRIRHDSVEYHWEILPTEIQLHDGLRLDIELPRGLVVAGTVSDSLGAGVDRVLISLTPDTEQGAHAVSRPVATYSLADGAFGVWVAQGGSYRITATKTGYEPCTRVLNVNGGTRKLQLTLPEIPPIEGRVVYQDTGVPPSGFWIRVLRRGAPIEFLEYADASGRFAIGGLARGFYDIESGDYRGSLSARVSVSVGAREATRADVNLSLVPGGSILGTVRSGDGAPICGARIHVGREGVRKMIFVGDSQGRRQADLRTDEHGRFLADCLHAGRYVVTVEHPAWISKSIHVNVLGNEQVPTHITVFRGGVLVVRVRDASGRSIPGARVRLIERERIVVGDRVRHLQYFREHAANYPGFDAAELAEGAFATKWDGAVERRFILPGRYRVEVWRRGYETSRSEVDIGEFGGRGSESVLTITLQGGEVQGRQ